MSGPNRGRTGHPRKQGRGTAAAPKRQALTLRDLHRARILLALATILEQDGAEQATVTKIVHRAGVPRTAFYQVFADRDDALCTLLENAFERCRAHVTQGSEAADGWEAQTKAGLVALLTLFEAEPQLARLCLIHSRLAAHETHPSRRVILEQLARHLQAGVENGRTPPSALTAESTVAGVLGVIEARLLEEPEPRLTRLSAPLMSFILLPYRGEAQARTVLGDKELRLKSRATAGAATAELPPKLRITYRTMRVLMTIANTPGLSNLEVARRAGIKDQGQMSKLLKRLTDAGLIQNAGGGPELGSANAWELTEEGASVERSLLQQPAPWSS